MLKLNMKMNIDTDRGYVTNMNIETRQNIKQKVYILQAKAYSCIKNFINEYV